MLLLPLGFMAQPAVVAAAAPLLLDSIAATVQGAFGLRKLRSAYAGTALQVRRSSDGVTQDFGFAAGMLDTAALLAFCGAGDGFVSKWYDQSGLGQDAVQATAAQQPQIVAAGVVASLNNATARPALRFTSTAQQSLGRAAFAMGGTASDVSLRTASAALIVACRTTAGDGYERLLSYTPPGFQDYQSDTGVIWAYFTGGNLTGYQGSGAAQIALGTAPFQASSVFSGTVHTLTLDGTAATASASGTLASSGALGIGIGAGQFWDGWQAEHIIVAGALTAADQTTIRTSQQRFYGTP